MPASQRATFRAFCIKQMSDAVSKDAAQATIRALDEVEKSERAAMCEMADQKADHRASLTGEARMLAEFEAAAEARDAATRNSLEAMTPSYIGSKLLEAVAVLIALPVGWFIGEIFGGHVGGIVLPFILAACVIVLFTRVRGRM